ncbi:MAG: hypothetical protein LBC41_07620 [Clostridiales bacterium]|nr:hypothetical protein [Clostridiales bacterium]
MKSSSKIDFAFDQEAEKLSKGLISVFSLENELCDNIQATLTETYRKEISAIMTRTALDWAEERAVMTAGGKIQLGVKAEVETVYGRVTYDTYDVVDVFGKTRHSFAEGRSGLAKTVRFMMLLCEISSRTSFRSTADIMNLHRRPDDQLSAYTVHDIVIRLGKEVEEAKYRLARLILKFFSVAASRPCADAVDEPIVKCRELDKSLDSEVESAIQSVRFSVDIDEISKLPLPDWMAGEARTEVEDAMKRVVSGPKGPDGKGSLIVSSDDVLVVMQPMTRPGDPEKGKRHYATETVIHITQAVEAETEKWSYVICGKTLDRTMDMLKAFLLISSLDNEIVFFTDGAANLRNALFERFGKDIRLILDWFHLKKRVNESLSMGLKGSALRKEMLKQLMQYLWHGRTRDACLIISRIPDVKVKKSSELVGLVKYLAKQSPYIPDYYERRGYQLKNSSNAVECANNLLVSKRQKGSGMSWSKTGSGSMASIKALIMNNELESFLRYGDGAVSLCKPFSSPGEICYINPSLANLMAKKT